MGTVRFPQPQCTLARWVTHVCVHAMQDGHNLQPMWSFLSATMWEKAICVSCNDIQVQVECGQSPREEVHSSFSMVQNKQRGVNAPEKTKHTEQSTPGFNPVFYPLNWSNPQLIACQAVLAWNRIYDETKSGGKHGWRLRKRGKMGDEAGDQLLRSHPGSRLILQSLLADRLPNERTLNGDTLWISAG